MFSPRKPTEKQRLVVSRWSDGVRCHCSRLLYCPNSETRDKVPTLSAGVHVSGPTKLISPLPGAQGDGMCTLIRQRPRLLAAITTELRASSSREPHVTTVVSCRVVSCRVVSCRVVSCRVVSCRVVCRVVSCRVVSCRVVSCVSCVVRQMFVGDAVATDLALN